MAVSIRLPPVFTDVGQVYSYLYQMAQEVNAAGQAAQALTDRQIEKAMAAAETASEQSTGARAEALRALIINTADILRHELDRIDAFLRSELHAESAYGTLDQLIESRLSAAAEGLQQQIDRQETVSDGLQSFRTRLQGCIQIGILNDGSGDTLGIAVGRNLDTREELRDGTPVTCISSEQTCAFYTDQGLSLRVGGREAAFFNNGGLRIGDVRVDGGLELGSWRFSQDGAGHLSLKWTGE